ncbi:MAG: zinc ribbon domain-containing protein [Anaerolineae bacterium]|nr:zinc ribbon domain-containing protein [Anaerolineae bacterium]
MSNNLKFLVDLHSSLLSLYPPNFKRQFKEEMAGVFSDSLQEAQAAGIIAMTKVCLLEMIDLPLNLLRQHLLYLSNAESLLTVESGMLTCPKCGHSSQLAASYCQHCGRSLHTLELRVSNSIEKFTSSPRNISGFTIGILENPVAVLLLYIFTFISITDSVFWFYSSLFTPLGMGLVVVAASLALVLLAWSWIKIPSYRHRAFFLLTLSLGIHILYFNADMIDRIQIRSLATHNGFYFVLPGMETRIIESQNPEDLEDCDNWEGACAKWLLPPNEKSPSYVMVSRLYDEASVYYLRIFIAYSLLVLIAATYFFKRQSVRNLKPA